MDAQPINGELLAGVLTELAEIASETLELQEVFDRVGACVRRVKALPAAHRAALRPIMAILDSAVEHRRLWDAERRRGERLERIEVLLVTLSQSLEVRDVFREVAESVRPVLPHDFMVLTELDPQARTIRAISWTGVSDVEPDTRPVALTEDELSRRIDFEIVSDIQAELAPDTARRRKILSTGMRSWLRVPLLLSGEVQGGLSLFHREPSRYNWEDAEVARRLADRLALMRSYQRLAEEARVAAETRERAERLEARVETLTRELEVRGKHRAGGVSASWRQSLRQVGRVAPSETTVLITGESGTGKEVIANMIHQGSRRAGKPFVALNCAALPEQLLESELFGHEKGAFTGAVTSKIGQLEQAEGGTLFLDEVAEMSPRVQAKFLRVLEEREFQRVGGTRSLQADVRVIAATNRDLGAGIASQTFREDLFYRLDVFRIHLAPLRERPDDILPLAEAFLEEFGRTVARPPAGISLDARAWLLEQRWPGNVRELRNAIERATLLCDGGLVTREHLPAPMRPPHADEPREPREPRGARHPASDGRDGAEPGGAGGELATMERGLIERALARARGNKTKAAQLLGLTRAQLYSRLERHGLR